MAKDDLEVNNADKFPISMFPMGIITYGNEIISDDIIAQGPGAYEYIRDQRKEECLELQKRSPEERG